MQNMAKKRCIRVAASGRAKAHIRCYKVAEKTENKERSNTGGGGGNNGNDDNNGGDDNDGGKKYRNPYEGDYKKATIDINDKSISGEKTFNALKAAGIPADVDGKIFINRLSDGRISVKTDTMDFRMERILNTENKTIINELFEQKKGQDGLYAYKGREVFARQVEHARAQGYEYIKTEAARLTSNRGQPIYVGYYVWLRCGYYPEKRTDNNHLKDVINNINKKHNTSYKKLEDFLKDESSRKIWKADGVWFFAEFDLKSSSYSSKTLAKYIKEKDGKN